MKHALELLHSRPLPDDFLRNEARRVTAATFYRRTLRKVALGLIAFVAVSTLALIIVSTVFADEIKASFGAPADCICVAMHPEEKPAPVGDLRM